jgi:hypothetical protein
LPWSVLRIPKPSVVILHRDRRARRCTRLRGTRLASFTVDHTWEP